MSDKINDTLGLAPMDEDKKDVIDMVPATKDDNLPAVNENSSDKNSCKVDTDAEYARLNIYDIIGKGAEAIEDLADVASQSQHPRAYEVLATLMKNMVEANKDLLELHKTKKEAKASAAVPDAGGDNVKQKNQIFVGSTDELLKMMENDK